MPAVMGAEYHAQSSGLGLAAHTETQQFVRYRGEQISRGHCDMVANPLSAIGVIRNAAFTQDVVSYGLRPKGN
jgi:hypothetical protein